MFRSWGEFNRYATDVFHLFADPISTPTGGVTSSPRPAEQKGGSAAPEVGLSSAGLECAFYVLFGRYPSATLLTDCFNSISSTTLSQSVAPPRLPSATDGSNTFSVKRVDQKHSSTALGGGCGARKISLSAYLRFITLCAEEEGPGLVPNRPSQQRAPADEMESSECTHLQTEAAKAAKLQYWRQFESVAGTKGFITLEDVCSIPMQQPFEAVHSVLQDPSLSPSSSRAYLDSSRRERTDSCERRSKALAQHVFWIMDGDHDGKVRFEDAKPYLMGSE